MWFCNTLSEITPLKDIQKGMSCLRFLRVFAHFALKYKISVSPCLRVQNINELLRHTYHLPSDIYHLTFTIYHLPSPISHLPPPQAPSPWGGPGWGLSLVGPFLGGAFPWWGLSLDKPPLGEASPPLFSPFCYFFHEKRG